MLSSWSFLGGCDTISRRMAAYFLCQIASSIARRGHLSKRRQRFLRICTCCMDLPPTRGQDDSHTLREIESLARGHPSQARAHHHSSRRAPEHSYVRIGENHQCSVAILAQALAQDCLGFKPPWAGRLSFPVTTLQWFPGFFFATTPQWFPETYGSWLYLDTTR